MLTPLILNDPVYKLVESRSFAANTLSPCGTGSNGGFGEAGELMIAAWTTYHTASGIGSWSIPSAWTGGPHAQFSVQNPFPQSGFSRSACGFIAKRLTGLETGNIAPWPTDPGFFQVHVWRLRGGEGSNVLFTHPVADASASTISQSQSPNGDGVPKPNVVFAAAATLDADDEDFAFTPPADHTMFVGLFGFSPRHASGVVLSNAQSPPYTIDARKFAGATGRLLLCSAIVSTFK